jgi:hypothetical protein
MGKTDNIFILLILIIFIIIFYFSLNSYNKPIKSILESFSDVNIGFESGQSSGAIIGTIKFNKPFKDIPQVFTQISGDASIKNNSYSIQIYNISTSGFDYSINMVTNEVIPNSSAKVATLQPAKSSEIFNWIALSSN